MCGMSFGQRVGLLLILIEQCPFWHCPSPTWIVSLIAIHVVGFYACCSCWYLRRRKWKRWWLEVCRLGPFQDVPCHSCHCQQFEIFFVGDKLSRTCCCIVSNFYFLHVFNVRFSINHNLIGKMRWSPVYSMCNFQLINLMVRFANTVFQAHTSGLCVRFRRRSAICYPCLFVTLWVICISGTGVCLSPFF